MKDILNQFDGWKGTLDDFQRNVKKDLLEVQAYKREIQRLRNDIVNVVEKGRYLRDEQRIVISAPEVIIGNVDRNGMLMGNGSDSKVLIRTRKLDLEGVGSEASITCKAPSIRGYAVNPGSDGLEHTVEETSEIIAQGGTILLKSQQEKDYFPLQTGAGGEGIRLESDRHIDLMAEASSENRKKQLNGLNDSIDAEIRKLEQETASCKADISSIMQQMQRIADDDDNLKSILSVRCSHREIDEMQAEFYSLTQALSQKMNDYFKTLSRLAEYYRRAAAIQDQLNDISQKSARFKTDTTGTNIRMHSEALYIQSVDGDGNRRSNPEACVEISAKNFNVNAYDENSALMPEGAASFAFENILLDTSNPHVTEKQSDFPAVGRVDVISRDISIQAVDYEQKKKGDLREEKALTKGGNLNLRAENISLSAVNTEGKTSGHIEANANEIELKSMDVDKKNRTDKSLAPGSTMLLLSDKMFAGSRDKKTKSKQVQIASDKIGVLGENLVELQQAKALVQLDGGNVAQSGGKTEIYGNTTVYGKTVFKSDIDAETVDMKNLKVKTSFKTPYTTEGVAVPGAPSTAKLNAKLEEEEMKKNDK